jgi:hypothetical protein
MHKRKPEAAWHKLATITYERHLLVSAVWYTTDCKNHKSKIPFGMERWCFSGGWGGELTCEGLPDSGGALLPPVSGGAAKGEVRPAPMPICCTEADLPVEACGIGSVSAKIPFGTMCVYSPAGGLQPRGVFAQPPPPPRGGLRNVVGCLLQAGP